MNQQQLVRVAPVVSVEKAPVLPFVTDCHRHALEQLGRAFTETRSLAILIGEGKSAGSFVIRSFLDGIGGDVAVARVTGPCSDANAGMREIIQAIGFEPKDMSLADLEDVFTMFLSLQMVRHRRTVICFEEAQDNGPWVLDRVHRLVELETEGKYGLMVILSGRPSLNKMLQQPPLNALNAEAADRINLAPYTLADTKEYVRRQIEAAANSDIGQIFASDAITLIHELSEGVPDAVINLYSRCLQMADGGVTATVTTDLVKKAAKLLPPESVVQQSDAKTESVRGNGAILQSARLIARMNGEFVAEQSLQQGYILIGRSRQCDLRIASPNLSRHHALVVSSTNGVKLVDLGSTNGTLVDGRMIKQYPLRDSDVITVGDCTIEYVAGDDRQA